MESKKEIYNYIRSISKYDFSEILKCARKLSKFEECEEYDLKIAVIGTYTLQFFTRALRVMLLRENINASIFEGDFNGINMEALDYESDLYKFKPEIVIILTDYRAIKIFPDILSEDKVVDEWVGEQMSYYKSIWKHIGDELHNCHIFQSNIVLPIARVLGNLESNYYFSKRTCISLLNIQFMRQRYNYVTIVDVEYVASVIGKDNWFDNASYMMNKSGFALQYIGIISDIFAKQIAALRGRVRKCLVLDLDNTLWGGIVGEDGYDGIQLEPNDSVGESYLTFQIYVADLKRRGVILAVCSKNDYEIAKEAFIKNEYMVLKFDDFSSFVANWDDKAENLKKISSELNIGTDSFVFFDDNPAEREIIKMFLPEVEVINVPEEPAEYVKALEMSNAFEWLQITKEDLQRNDSYLNNKKRMELLNFNCDYNEYLKSLDMHVTVCEPNKHEIERFTQLINKSNQFNLRTQRYTQAEILNMSKDVQYKFLNVKLSDKFGNYGIISCVILKVIGEHLFIDTWVMSCRVLKRRVEYHTFEQILKVSEELGCNKIVGEYIPTAKNAIVKNLYNDIEFEKCTLNQFKTEESSDLYIYDTKRMLNTI